MRVLAYHFVGHRLRDGREVPADGVTLTHAGPLMMCQSGLHSSRRLIDALGYAPGSTLCRVRVSGKMIEDTDKLVASERTILWRLPAEVMDPILYETACYCAEQALLRERMAGREPDPRLFRAIEARRGWLRGTVTDKELSAVHSVASSAAYSAASSAAYSAAYSAVHSVAYSVAYSAAYSAAYWAASSAAWAARSAASSAADLAAYSAATKDINDYLTRLVSAAADSCGFSRFN